MAPKGKEVKGKVPPQITRPSISDATLTYVPQDAVDGYQERIETGINWTVVEEAARHHKDLCSRVNIPHLSFTEALETKIKNSFLIGFLDEESSLNLDEQWELLPLTLWDNDQCASNEGKVCFRNRNCITEDMIKLIKKAVKAGDRNVLREDLKLVNVLRVTDSEMTTLDEGVKEYPNLITLNLCGNFISELNASVLSPELKILELQANAIRDTDPFIEHLPQSLLYLGLARNLLINESVVAMGRLPHRLTALDLSDNDIYSLDTILLAIARLPCLTSLMLAGNPCSVCAAYARTLISVSPHLKWLDYRKILPTDRPEQPFEVHPDDLRSSYFYFTIFRIMSVPPPPKVEKGTTQTFHVEFELPLLDSDRRGFLMFRRNESLAEMLPAAEDDEEWPVSKITSLHIDDSKAAVEHEASSEETDVYAQLTTKNSRQIIHYTVFESNKVSWNKVINFQEPAFRIFCPDLVALRNTFRTVVTLRLIYNQTTAATKSKPTTKSVQALKPPPSEQRVVLATIRCGLRRVDWSQPCQHFHWDDTLGTQDAMHWGDGDLSVLQYTQTPTKPIKGGKEVDAMSFKTPIPENLTCHFGFGIEPLSS